MARDIFGRKRGASDRQDHPVPYEISASTGDGGTVRYTRFFDTGDEPCGIMKEEYQGELPNPTFYRCTWAFDRWDNRANATYVPVNECWDYEN